MSLSSQQPPPPSSSSAQAATTADSNNDDIDIDTNTNTKDFSIIIRGRIIRKRKYHDHISFAIRSLIVTTTPLLPSPPILIMIPRNNPSFSLDGIFIGTIIEATVERQTKAEAEVVEAATTITATTTTTETTTTETNKNKSNNSNNNHQLAKSFKIIGCSPDPNAIQVCLNLVFGGIGIEKGDDENENKPPKKLLPVSIFSYYDNNTGSDGCNSKSMMIPLFLDDNDLQVIQQILKLNSKDPILRKSFISRLSRALKGDDKEFTLVVDENDSSSGDAIKLKNDGPRKRLTHVKHRQKLVLEKMEVSQSPLEDVLVRTITVDGDDDNDDDDVNNDNNDDDEKESTLKSKVSSSSLSKPSLSEKGIVVVPNIPKVVENGTSSSSTNNGTMNMMSIRHPRTRIEYLVDKKYPQIQWLLQRMSPIIDKIRIEKRNSNDNGKDDNKDDKQSYYINVLDVGGGRGDIAVAVATEFHDVKVTVVDMNESSLQAGKDYYEESMKMKNSDNTSNNTTETETVNDNDTDNTDTRAHFICDDFAHFAKDAFNNNRNTSNNTSNNNNNSKATTFDIVIAWHACGDLSDYALEYSIRSNSVKAFLINPCCYTKRYIKTFTPKYIRQYSNYCSPVVVDNNVDNVNHDVNHANHANANNIKESAPEATTTATTIATTTTNTTTPTPFDNKGMTKNTDTNKNTTIMTTNEFKTKNNYNKNGSNSKNNNQQDKKYPPQDKNQQQQQQVNSNHDIKIIQKLAEINERPEYTSRAMRLLNTMRIQSLLVLQNELNLNSKPSTTTTTTTATPIATAAATAAATATATGTSSSSPSPSLLFDITLEEYNIEYSSKNLVLIGVNNNVC